MTSNESHTAKPRLRWLAWVNAATFLIQRILNETYMGGFVSTSSHRKPNLIVPANYAFEIWTVIYALLTLGVIVDCVYPVLSVFSYTDARLRWLFVVACITNIGWTFASPNDYVNVIVVLLIVQWLSLGVIYSKIVTTRREHGFSLGRYICSELGLTIYFGWASAATLLSIAVAVQAASGQFLSFSGYLVLLTLLAAFTISIVLYIGDVTIAGVALWALVAVAMREHAGLDEAAAQVSLSLRGAAAQSAAIITAFVLVAVARKVDERFGPFYKTSSAERALPLLSEKIQSTDYGTSSV